MGYLPEAVNNYLLRLGWGHGDAEIIDRDQAVQWFGLANVRRSHSRSAVQALENLNAHYLRAADNARLAGLVAPRVQAMAARHMAHAAHTAHPPRRERVGPTGE